MHDPIDLTVWRHPKVKRPIYLAIDHRDDRVDEQLADECAALLRSELAGYLHGTHDALFIAIPLLRDGATRVHLTVDRDSVDDFVALLDPLVVWATDRWLDRTGYEPRHCRTCDGWVVMKSAAGAGSGPCTQCGGDETTAMWDHLEAHVEPTEDSASTGDSGRFLDR